jgi:hypothetical protein
VPVYWRWTPTVAVPFFVAGLIDHQHRVGVVELPGHVLAQVVADAVGVPYRPAQQVLHAVRIAVAGYVWDRHAAKITNYGWSTSGSCR